jgi:hypothetical protein
LTAPYSIDAMIDGPMEIGVWLDRTLLIGWSETKKIEV